MRSLMPRAVLLVALSLGCNGPLPFVSGGALSGKVATTPAEWSAFPEFAVVQLETRPEDPYSVNIASTLVDGVLYINAGDTETEWVKHMEENPHVRLRNDGVLYELRSERVTDADEISRFGVAWTSHGVFHRDPSELEEVWVYRLEAR
jgi:hypothetical protein